jgi:lysophospholipase L1-like esterase
MESIEERFPASVSIVPVLSILTLGQTFHLPLSGKIAAVKQILLLFGYRNRISRGLSMKTPPSGALLRFFMSVPLVFLTLGLFSACHAESADDSSSATKWVGTWYTAPQLVETGNNPPAPGLSNNTLRQILRISIGGDTLRLRLSNEFSTSSTTFHEVHIALSRGGSTIDTTTDQVLHFGGKTDTTLAPGAAVTSDPFHLAVSPRTDMAVTIYYGATSVSVTGHPGSRTTSYLLSGNAVSRADFAGAVTTDHWYNILGIDVLAPPSAACVAILGNSITDGRGSTTNMQNRWPDVFSESLLQDSSTQHVGVLNAGIGGNAVLTGGLGPTGVSRYDRDILNQQGIRWAIIYDGVNDIGGVRNASAATTTANNLISAYEQMVVKAHANNIRVYGATIMPFGGNGYFNQYSEQCRSTVNQWIRTVGNFDGCIDFDLVMRDPQDTTRLLLPTYQNDGLHPDTAGHRTMGQSIDRNLFSVTDTTTMGVNSQETMDRFALGQNYPNPFNPRTVVGSQLSVGSNVRLAVYDLLGREVSVLVNEPRAPGRYQDIFDGSRLASGVYIYRLSSGTFTQAKKMLLIK